jgi:hypothetical protein
MPKVSARKKNSFIAESACGDFRLLVKFGCVKGRPTGDVARGEPGANHPGYPALIGGTEQMSVQALSWVIEKSRQRGSNFVVLLMIANHAHSDGTNSFPSYERLAFESRLKPRRVMDIVDSLRLTGELKIEKGAGPHGTNIYSLPLMLMESTDIGGVQVPAYAIPGTDLRQKLHPNRNEPNEPSSTSLSKPLLKNFAPPTEEEVSTYMVEQGVENPEAEAKAFIDHHETRGWIPSGQRTQMKSWKAAVRTWKHFQKQRKGGYGFKNKAQQASEHNTKVFEAALARHQPVAGDLFPKLPQSDDRGDAS